MISYTAQRTQFGDLSQNTTTANLDRGSYLANQEQKYLLEKYFSNEISFSIQTIGSQSLTATGSILSGATSATLTVAWAYPSSSAFITFSDGEQRSALFTYNSAAITWQGALTATVTSTLSVGGVQTYRLPSDYSKLKTGTLTIGSLKWTPTEILTRQQWDNLNVFPYYADIPNNFFIWNNQFNLWPIPSTTGNIISFNYKRRIPDLSLADYTTGTVSVTNGSITITGSGTVWTPTTNLVSESRWIQISQTKGDNLWYQIQSVDSATSITLYAPYQGITVSGGSYILGQMPLLMEDFQDMLVYKPLVVYFTSIVDNKVKAKEFQDLYDRKLRMLEEYAGSKTINVNLSRKSIGQNPNLYSQDFGATGISSS